MSGMKGAKRHHLVPQFYLRRFAVNDKLELIERDDLGKVLPSTVRKALAENHFYDMQSETKPPDLWVEEEFFANNLETKAARALRRGVDEGVPLDRPGLRSGLSLFIAVQFARGQATRQPITEWYKAISRKIVEAATPEYFRKFLREYDGTEITDQEAREALDLAKDPARSTIGLRNENNAQLKLIAEMARLAEHVAGRSWRLLTFANPVLVTSDEPVGLVGRSLSPGEPLGILTAPDIVFSTDPWHALVLSTKDGEPYSRSEGNARMANLINRHVAFRAHRFIVRRPGTDPLRGIVLPKKASALSVTGNEIVMRLGISQKEAKKERRKPRRRLG